MATTPIFSRNYSNGGGWYPLLSPNGRFVAHGFGVCIITNLETGVDLRVRIPGDSLRVQPSEWNADNTLVVCCGGGDDAGHVYTVSASGYVLQAGTVIPAQTVPRTSLGHTMIASGRRVWIDGQEITAFPCHWNSKFSWPWALIPDPTDEPLMRIYRCDRATASPYRPSWPITASTLTVVDGLPVVGVRADLGGGLNAPVLFQLGSSERRVDVMPPLCQNESAPEFIGPILSPWVATTTEHYPSVGGDTTHVYLRPAGDPNVIDIPVDFATGAQVYPYGDLLRVVTSDSEGRLRVFDANPADPRSPVPALPPDPTMRDPVVHLDVSVAPASITVRVIPDATSGELTAWRVYVDYARRPENQPDLTFDATPGGHTIMVRVAAKNGKVLDLLPVLVTVPEKPPTPPETPVDPQPPIEPPIVVVPPVVTAFLKGTNFMPPRGAGTYDARPDFQAAGFNAVRLSPREWTPAEAFACAPWLTPMWIVNDADELAMIPDGSLATFRNEPNIGDGPAGQPALSAQEYARRALLLAPIAKARGIRIYWGSVSNTGSSEQGWLSVVLSLMGASGEYVDFHRYPQDGSTTQDWSKGRKDFKSLDEEFAALRRIMAGRRWICSEFGIKECQWKTCFGGTKRVDRTEQARLLRGYARWFLAQPDCDGAFVYQSWEGQTPSFGLTDFSGHPKPALGCWS